MNATQSKEQGEREDLVPEAHSSHIRVEVAA